MKNIKPKCSSIILINEKDEVLMLLRDNKKEILFPNCYDLIGGHSENKETPFDTIKRECFEETNYSLKSANYFMSLETPYHIETIFWDKISVKLDKLVCGEGQKLEFIPINKIYKYKIAFNFDLVCLLFYRYYNFHREL